MNRKTPVATETLSQTLPSGNDPVYSFQKVETGIDIVGAILTLVRGWKILLATALIGGLLAAWVVRVSPTRYEAKTTLAVAAGEDFSPLINSLLSLPKPSPELLQEYANQLVSPEVLEQTADQLREEYPGLETPTADEIREILTVAPLKDEGKLTVSVAMGDPELAKQTAAVIVQCGTEAIEQFRQRQEEAVRKYWSARVDSAHQAYQQSQNNLLQIQKEQKYVEKNARLREANRRVELLRQILISTETEISKLESRIRIWESLLPTLPETTVQTFHWEGGESLLRALGVKAGTSEKEPFDMQFVWKTPSPNRQAVERNLLEDRAALQALQTARQNTQKSLEECFAELDQAQSEMDTLNAVLSLAQWELQAARNRYTAARESLAKWLESSASNFPMIRPDSISSIRVQTKGLSAAKRWIALEVLAVFLGGLGVFLLEAVRRRKQAISSSSLEKLPSLTPEEQQMIISQRMSA